VSHVEAKIPEFITPHAHLTVLAFEPHVVKPKSSTHAVTVRRLTCGYLPSFFGV